MKKYCIFALLFAFLIGCGENNIPGCRPPEPRPPAAEKSSDYYDYRVRYNTILDKYDVQKGCYERSPGFGLYGQSFYVWKTVAEFDNKADADRWLDEKLSILREQRTAEAAEQKRKQEIDNSWKVERNEKI